VALIKENSPGRRGIYTTAVISEGDFGKIVLYLTGRRHAGENMDRIIRERKNTWQAILMSDALFANNKADYDFLRSYCLAHGRRRFFDSDKKFKEACDFVLEKIQVAYKNDKHCKENNLTPAERLMYHQKCSSESMKDLENWCLQIINNGEVEPSSDLYREVAYLMNHWEGLTSFLRIEGAELDNNQLEQKIRLQVLNRKNWLFYKTELGALIGDIICSFIKTCEAAKVNPIEYYIWVMKNTDQVKLAAESFLPWEFESNN
jgi:transposase